MARSLDGDIDTFDIFTGIYIGTVSYNLRRLRTTNVNKSNEKRFYTKKRKQETDKIPQKLLRIQTT